ncbi:MAG: arginine deiminase-related protein [bacterium]
MSESAREPAKRLTALTHVPSPNMQQYERKFVGDQWIDYELALAQHASYEETLRQCGAEVVTLDVNRSMADCVFIEDTAIVLDEVAVMMSPGAASRRNEPRGIEPVLRRFREIERVSLPATIDGGDVVRAGRSLYVGASPRTNAAGIDALRELLRSYGYTVTAVPVRSCLHLKTACSSLPDGRFLVNADWIDASPLPASRLLQVPRDEPWAGDVLVAGDAIVYSNAFPQTGALMQAAGYATVGVFVSEFAKAEGGVTCLSLVFRD